MSYPSHFALPAGYQIELFFSEFWSPQRLGSDGIFRVPPIHNQQGVPMAALAFTTEEEAREWCRLDAAGVFSEPLQANETDGTVRLEDVVRKQ